MFDTFLKIDGIPGESTDDAHKDWIEVLDFGHEMTQPASATASSAGGAGAERTDHKDYQVKKLLDKASAKIYEALCKGTHIKEVTIEMCRAGGDKVKYMEIKMEEVIVANVQVAGNPKGGHGFPSEVVSFDYGKITWTYTQQKRTDGSGGGNVSAGWSLIANKAN